MQTLNPKLSSQPCKPQRENSENMFPKNLSVGVGVLLDFDADFVCVALQTTSEKKNEKEELVEKGGGSIFPVAICTKKQENTEKLKKHLKKRGKSILAPSTLNPKKCLCGFRVCSSANNKREKIEKKELVEKGGVHFSCGDWYQKTEKHKKTKKTLERTPKKHSCNSKAAKFKKKSSPNIA